MNTFQQVAYISLVSQASGLLKQVIGLVTNINTTMAGLAAIQARLTASLTTPDPQFGAANQEDVDTIDAFLAQWTTVQAQPLSFEQVVAAFLAAPPQV